MRENLNTTEVNFLSLIKKTNANFNRVTVLIKVISILIKFNNDRKRGGWLMSGHL